MFCTTAQVFSALREKLFASAAQFLGNRRHCASDKKKIDWFLDGTSHDDLNTNVMFFFCTSNHKYCLNKNFWIVLFICFGWCEDWRLTQVRYHQQLFPPGWPWRVELNCVVLVRSVYAWHGFWPRPYAWNPNNNSSLQTERGLQCAEQSNDLSIVGEVSRKSRFCPYQVVSQ